MEIKCKASKRYLLNVNIESYYDSLKKIGVDITVPLTIEIPCRKCKMIEVYEIYPNNYVHTKSYKREINILQKHR